MTVTSSTVDLSTPSIQPERRYSPSACSDGTRATSNRIACVLPSRTPTVLTTVQQGVVRDRLRVRVRPEGGLELLADLGSSRVSVAVIKDRNSKLPVNGTMLLRDGRVTLDGPSPSAQLSIDLTTLETDIPTRNERVKKLFFETNNRSWETIELAVPTLPPAALAALRDKRRATHVEPTSRSGT